MDNAKQVRVLAINASILVLAIAIGNIINGFNSNDSTASSAPQKAAVQQNEPELQMVQMKSISNSLKVQDTYQEQLEQRVHYKIKIGDTPWEIAKILKPDNVQMDDYINVLLTINDNKVLKIGNLLDIPNDADLKNVILPDVSIHFNIHDNELIEVLIEAEGSQLYQSTVKSKSLNGYNYSFRNNKFYPYKDKFGEYTIGYGHYLGSKSTDKEVLKYAKGISANSARKLLISDMEAVYNDFTLMLKEKNSINLPPNIQKVLFEMTFNLGSGKVKDFKKMWKSLNNGNYLRASKEMRNSYWASQVGSRADRLIQLVAIEKHN